MLIGVLVNVLSSQAERVVPPPSSASSSAAPHLEVDGVSLTDPGAPVKFIGSPFTPFKVDIKTDYPEICGAAYVCYGRVFRVDRGVSRQYAR